MTLYPSLEDMKMDQLIKAQEKVIVSGLNQSIEHKENPSSPNAQLMHVYPMLNDFMGLELSNSVIAFNMPELLGGTANSMIAPLSNQTLGLQKAQVTHGVRELILCKDKDGKVGLRVKAIDNGIFVTLVLSKSPAALAGLRFGDQILQINGTTVAGFTMEKVHELLKKSPTNGISVVVRDRPFERTLTLMKDSAGYVGFQFKNGKIISIIQDSSAAKNGVLIEHQLLEIDGQNVVGMKDKEVSKIIEACDGVVTITVIPSFIYDHMIKRMAGSLLKELMDHSVPNI